MAEEQQHKQSTSNKSISRSAFTVTIGSVFTMLAGLVSQIVIASIFGAGAEMDAFFTALVVPMYLQGILLGGLSFVFIPAFIREEETGDDENAWALVGTFIWLTSAIFTTLAVTAAMFAPNIIALTAPGLDAEKAELTAYMLAIMMFAVPVTGLGSLTKGVENARNRFFLPALAPAVGSLGNVLLLVLLYDRIGALALAWGYLFSMVLQAAMTAIPVFRHGWTRLMPLRDERVREMAVLVAPFIFFGILTRCTPLIERYFASGLPDGQLSYLGYGTKVGKIVANVLGAGITTAIFPAMARAYSRQGERGLVDRTEYGMRLTVAVSLPALAILSAVSVPLIIVLFERGAFDRATTLSVSQVIPMMIMGEVVFFMLGNVITRTFYATKNTHTVPIIMTITSILFIFLAAWLTSIGGYVGLAWTKPITSALGIVLLVFLMVWRLPYFQVGWLLRTLLFYGLVSLATFTLTREVAALLAATPAIVQLLAASTVGGVFYLGLLFFVDREITVSILETTGIRTIFARLGLLRIVQRLAPGGIANQR